MNRICFSDLFLELMKHSEFMIGNSSSGIREAPTFKTPYICIGSRQNGRERSVNVIDSSYNTLEIMRNVKYVTSNKKFITLDDQKIEKYSMYQERKARNK